MTTETQAGELLTGLDMGSRRAVHFKRLLSRTLMSTFFAFAGLTLGCQGRSPSGPTQSIPVQPTTPAALTVSAITPNSGVPDGATVVTDVVVTNSDGQIGRLAGGYTFASPQSFDFNGAWAGDDHDGPAIRFTIQNDALASLACGTSTPITFSAPVPVTNGEFSFSRDDGVAVSGRILSPSAARGTINVAPCTATTWYAEKQ